jgi:methyltransferase (TIGR00027 family)
MTRPSQIEPLALTAFYCCALRAADAASPNPVCGDTFAARFMDDETLARLRPLLRFRGPSVSNVARHRIIDDIVRNAIQQNSALKIVILGAGLDTRAFRLKGGQWWELDDASLIAFKDERLPSHTAPNPLTRIAIDFKSADLREYLAPIASGGDTLVVLEGVSMYLPSAALTNTATAVRDALSDAPIVCDLMSPAFRRRFSKGLHRELQRLGAHFAPNPTHPRLAIEAAGYRLNSAISIVDRARQAGTVRIPSWLLNSLLRELRDGYAIHTFAR